MAFSLTEFKKDLYREHLEEASFLVEHIHGLRDDPHIRWPEIGEFEDRLEAHIDALVVGGDLAEKVCRKRSVEGDFGELYAAIRVFCRQNHLEAVESSLAKLDSIDHDDSDSDDEHEQKARAICDALKIDLPESWFNDIQSLLKNVSDANAGLLAGVIGFRRIPAEKELIFRASDASEETLLKILRALGGLGSRTSIPMAYKCLEHGNPDVCINAAMALMRMGEKFPAIEKYTPGRNKSCLALPMGFWGDRSNLPVLLDMASQQQNAPESTLALGLLGDIEAVEPLIAFLDNPNLAELAALALNLITGANLFEELPLPEDTEKEDFSPEEMETPVLDKNERINDETAADSVRIISRDPNQWKNWWNSSKNRFSPNSCYRNGTPHSPACLLESIKNESSPRIVRDLAHEELAIRYRINIPFESDMAIGHQMKAIKQYENIIQPNTRYTKGK